MDAYCEANSVEGTGGRGGNPFSFRFLEGEGWQASSSCQKSTIYCKT